ncbi:TPA: bifunctional precorrin-2 dehydrogenase/sirohydrochlorin ferrochelatase [Candidatus Poribacteria bacterium]|nr:bifunctional precorrin-2 dehydrogenase/sirohydrochlorin ferrochelatase [Candidatus Poribacteria bacterium]
MLYPIYLDLRNRKCVVVGGGEVAQRKVLLLLQCGAKVVVVSPDVTEKLAELAKDAQIIWYAREFEPDDLSGAFLVHAATDKPAVNSSVSKCARTYGISLINVVDTPVECTFITPSIVARSDLIISISTSGKSPALAKRIRQQLEKQYGTEYAEFLDILGEARKVAMDIIPTQRQRRQIFEKIIDCSEVFDLIKIGEKEEARRLTMQIIIDGKTFE